MLRARNTTISPEKPTSATAISAMLSSSSFATIRTLRSSLRTRSRAPRDDADERNDRDRTDRDGGEHPRRFHQQRDLIDAAGLPEHPFAREPRREQRIARGQNDDAVAGCRVHAHGGVDRRLIAVVADDEIVAAVRHIEDRAEPPDRGTVLPRVRR